jgi:hypothetical protein
MLEKANRLAVLLEFHSTRNEGDAQRDCGAVARRVARRIRIADILDDGGRAVAIATGNTSFTCALWDRL